MTKQIIQAFNTIFVIGFDESFGNEVWVTLFGTIALCKS